MASDILVKISADAKQFNDEIEKVKRTTEGLSDGLSGIAKAAGAVFAGLVGSAGVAIKQFRDSEKASVQLTNALENQGLAAEELSKSYKSLAKEISKKTGIDDDAIVAAQATVQTYIGQTEVTAELSAAIVDLSTKTGSLESAAEILGRAYQGNTRALKQYGITVDENATSQERLEQAIAGVNQKVGGQAEALGKGAGSFAKVQVAAGNLIESIGERLTPVFEKINIVVAKFITTIEENDALVDLAVKIGTVVAAVAGIVTALATAGLAIVQFNNILATAGIALKAFGISARFAVSATGIGILLIVLYEIYDNWSVIVPKLSEIWTTTMNVIANSAGAFAKLAGGIVTKDLSLIKSGIDDFRSSISQEFKIGAVKKTDIEEARDEKAAERAAQQEAAKQEAVLNEQKKAANAAAIERKRLDDINKAQTRISTEIAIEQARGGSDAVIKLKQQEKDILTQLEQEKNKGVIEALQERLVQVRELEAEAEIIAAEQRKTFQDNILANNEEFRALSAEQQKAFLAQYQTSLVAAQETAATTRNKIALQALQEQQAANAKYLQDQQKFGAAYADINRIIYSDKVKAAKDTSGELAALAQSENSTLKAIGKAAAVTQITISTAEAAMKVYAGFQALPFGLGIPLGIAAAAAVTAFGAERIGKVLSAQSGGIVPGIQKGGDSVPALLQPGELVVPRQSFSQITQAIANRAIANDADTNVGISTPAGVSEGPQMIAIGFDGPEAEKVITARRVEARALGVLRESTA